MLVDELVQCNNENELTIILEDASQSPFWHGCPSPVEGFFGIGIVQGKTGRSA